MTHLTIRRIVRQRVETAGWRSGTSLEDKVSLWLHKAGFRPALNGRCDNGCRIRKCFCIRQQWTIDRFRVDYAIPDLKVVVEADGWWHRSPEGAAKDAERDSWLRSRGWLVLRVDDRHGDESLDEQVVRACQVIHLLADRHR